MREVKKRNPLYIKTVIKNSFEFNFLKYIVLFEDCGGDWPLD